MSKKFKELMGYNPKPKQKICSNCVYFKSEFVENEYHYKEEKNIQCSLGGFAVKKTANCKEHEFKTL